MNWLPAGQCLVLIVVANGVPPLATAFLPKFLNYRIDCRVRWLDGRPLLGRSKTVRGFVLSLASTAAIAPVIGLPWSFGLVVAITAMSGDMVSSFLKRRFRLPAGRSAPVLDQVPESLFPALVGMRQLELTSNEVIVVVASFAIAAFLASGARAWLLCRLARN